MYQVIIVACCALSVTASYNDSALSNKTDGLGRTTIDSTIKKYKHEDRGSHRRTNAYSSSEKNIVIGTGRTYNQAKSTTVNPISQKNSTFSAKHRHFVNDTEKPVHILYRIHATVTRSKDAIWATITLTFLCVLLVISVAQSRMWKDYYGFEPQGIPLPNFNERVLFKDVMKHKVMVLKQIFNKRKKERKLTELESLLSPSELEQ